MELRYSPYQRKKGSRKAKPMMTTITRPRTEGLKWTLDEDSLLRDGVCKYGGKKWKTIAEHLERRSPEECSKRWNKLQSLDTVVKRPWAPEEDAQMFQLVKKYGASKWAVIASYLAGRNGKQCRERWHNQLNPLIKKTPWTDEENAIIVTMQAQFGNCWAKITSQLPGRTDNAVKNHWHSSLKTQANRARGVCEDESSKRSKLKKKANKVKSSRLATNQPVWSTIDEAGLSEASVCAVEDMSMDASPVTSAESPMVEYLAHVCDFLDSPVIQDEGLGSLSPDAVSSVDNLDLYAYAYSYQDGVTRAQAVIDNILDPMGMDTCSDNSFPALSLPDDYSCRTTDHSKSDLVEAWGVRNDDNGSCSIRDELLEDSAPPAPAPSELDELLFGMLHDVCEDDTMPLTTGMESSDLILSAPLGEIARVYKRPQQATEWDSCVSHPSPTAAALAEIAFDSTSLTTNLSMNSTDESLLQCKDEVMFEKHDDMFDEGGYTSRISSLPSLLDVGV